jgi:xylulose-5-phosphate/fructose-6-phosphate phosphoketolase
MNAIAPDCDHALPDPIDPGLGRWGASPALSFVWTHLNRVIKRDDLDMIFVAGPGHGAPGVLGPVTPETPGSIHEGGELGYSLSNAYGCGRSDQSVCG